MMGTKTRPNVAMTGLKLVLFTIGVFLAIVGIFAFMGWVFAIAWNASIAPIFGITQINLIQGMALIFIASVIFGRIGGDRRRDD